MKKQTTYITDDGKHFNKKQDAERHQQQLDSIDFKSEYFRLLEKVESLERELRTKKGLWDGSYQGGIMALSNMATDKFVEQMRNGTMA